MFFTSVIRFERINGCVGVTVMSNSYTPFTASGKAATLPSMGMHSASGGIPSFFDSFPPEIATRHLYLSTSCVPNFGLGRDPHTPSTCDDGVSHLIDAQSPGFWAPSRDKQVQDISHKLSQRTAGRTLGTAQSQSSIISHPGVGSNERVVSPGACSVSSQLLVCSSATASHQPLIQTDNPHQPNHPANESVMVLSQHSPVSAAKVICYGASANQKTFAGNYKNVQAVVTKPPPARYHSSSSFNAVNYSNGHPCVDGISMKPLRNMYPVEIKNGMRDVPMWLKSLRLHKYTQLFQQMGYDEMMTLDERKLEAFSVTKGARRKIMQSIQKLRERVPMLKQMEKSIEERGSDVACVIAELRGTMNTPIRSFPPPSAINDHYLQTRIDGIGYTADQLDDENLPGHITRIVGKVHDSIMEGRDRIVPPLEDEYYGWLLQTYDRITNHEAFTVAQKQRVASWKRAMRKVCSPLMGRKGTRLPHASVLLASGNANPVMSQPPQCSPSSSLGSRLGNNSPGGNPSCASHVMSQTALQNVVSSLLNACNSRVPLSPQAAAYYLGVASITSLLSSPELVKQLQDLIALGNAPPAQFQQQLHQQLFANAFPQNGSPPPPQPNNSNNPMMHKPVPGLGGAPFSPLQQPPPPHRPQLSPQSNVWKNFPPSDSQTPFGLSEPTHTMASYSMSDKMTPMSMSECSLAACLTTSTSSMQQSNCSTGGTVHPLYLPAMGELRPMGNPPGSCCIPSTSSNPLEAGLDQRLPPPHHPFPQPPSPPSQVVSSAHRRSSSNTSSVNSGLCSKWGGVNEPSSNVGGSLFESVTLPLTHMNSMPSMHSAVQQQRRLSNQESSLFGAARPACASSVSPSSRMGSSSSSGYSSSASDRSSGAGSPPGLMVFNFASEHASGELDNMCRDVAALNFKKDSQLLHMNLQSSVLP